MTRELLTDLRDWRLTVDVEGIAWATFDREAESANALGRRPLEELMRIVGRVEEAARGGEIKGLVIQSGKDKGFIVGADIREFDLLTSETAVGDAIRPVNAMLDRIEAMKVPVVAAVHGVCVGGGLELILACHYRIATRDESTRFGFPEVKLGIFPGFNGTARSIRQAGPIAAMDAMLTGRMISASAARAQGLVDQLVDAKGSLHWAARKAVLEKRRSKPAPQSKMILARWPARSFVAGKMREQVKREAREAHYPAPYRLIDLFEAHGGSFDAMKAHETRAFAPLMVSDTARNLRRVFRLSEALKAQAPKDLDWKPRRLHVIGAGTMGADIAGYAVASGMEVTLQDLSADQIAKGIEAQGKLFARRFKTKAQRDAARARLISDPHGRGLAQADVVIEAIVENLDIKRKLFADIETKVRPDCVLATNTSSLQIEDIATAMADPSRLVGIHFFNPVAKMPLVEVVRGAASDAAMIGKASAFVTGIGKFPLVVKSVPGFLVNRVLAPYMLAAMKRVDQGEDMQKIDEAARVFGMPMGPIELADTVGLDVCAHVGKILGLEAEGAGGRLERLVASGKLGKKSGEGFYVWKDGKPEKKLETYNEAELERLGRDLVEPLIEESNKALRDGVVESADLVDAGVIFGTGFAPFRGGPLNYRNESGGNASTAAASTSASTSTTDAAAE
ncbi:MAG: 3-hydroxyacyl-CoA dehydrogenase NAD-binding domain-containing protein [Hyphomicrobiaceae bacterium]